MNCEKAPVYRAHFANAYLWHFINLKTKYRLIWIEKTIKKIQQNQRLQEWASLCMPQSVLVIFFMKMEKPKNVVVFC